MVDLQVIVKTEQNGSYAVIQELAPGVCLDDVELLLKSKGIVNGILKDDIDLALKKTSEGETLRNLVVARSVPGKITCELCGSVLDGGINELKEKCLKLPSAQKVQNADNGSDSEFENIFLRQNETFLYLTRDSSDKDVYNNELSSAQLNCPHFDQKTINVLKKNVEVKLVALIDGYLCCDSNGLLRVVSPVLVKDNAMRMFFLVLPLVYGKEACLDVIKNLSEKESVSQTVIPSNEEISLVCDGKKAAVYLIKQGSFPVSGTDAVLHINSGEDISQKADENMLRIDPHARTPFHDVKRDVVIAVLTLSVAGIPGKDIYGNLIPVAEVKDISFNAGSNVERRQNGNTVSFVALVDGVATFADDSVSVNELLTIAGNVGPQTGNITTAHDVVVGGDVIGGFIIHCGGNCSIRGNVENGARIFCDGTLSVNGGVFGQQTRIANRKHVQIGFIQNCILRVEGTLSVKRYVYDSIITCGGELKVEGQGIDDSSHGAVVGGKICSLKHIALHSIGSSSAITECICGVDPEVQEILNKVVVAVTAISRNILMLQNSLKIDMNDPGIREKIKHMSPDERLKMKNKIIHLKQMLTQKNKLSESLENLKNRMQQSQTSDCRITVLRKLIPDVRVRMANATLLMKETVSGVVFRLHDLHIMPESLVKNSGN